MIPWALVAALPAAAGSGETPAPGFPPALDAYAGEAGKGLFEILAGRIATEPLNLLATLIFAAALVHTFLAPRLLARAHHMEAELAKHRRDEEGFSLAAFRAEILHFLGEIEVVFLLWAVPLVACVSWFKGWSTTEYFLGHLVQFTEPMFVVVILSVAGTKPVLDFAEVAIGRLAALGGGSPFAWWVAILTVGPLLGSFITEPAAMVISALLLSRTVFRWEPTLRLRYATLGLLFANISVGGTLTHFAAPPVLMVASAWGWTTPFMLRTFGWKAVLGVLAATALYAILFRRELRALDDRARAAVQEERKPRAPGWLIGIHLLFLAWTVFTAHTPPLFVGGFLFFLAFHEATSPEQDPLELRSSLLVGCFLAGLVVHGSLQAWWVAPILGSLSPLALLFGAAALTAVNDNAAITYLASLVPGFSPASRYAVVAGAVAGGGLTVIANAPNPAGQALLGRFFPDGISPLRLAAGALPPTAVLIAFLLIGS